MAVPSYSQFMNPLLDAMHELGGSGTIEEIAAKVISAMKLNKQQIEQLHNPEKSSNTEVEYRLAWARTYLKLYGLLENSSRGVWALTPQGVKTTHVDPPEVNRAIKSLIRKPAQHGSSIDEPQTIESLELLVTESWEERLRGVLLNIEPSAFERLTQRLLRESGFVQVNVTGRSGDGGIDGNGILEIGSLINFRVLFQCKRYKGTVGPDSIRDFRGAMIGRAERGLFVTTGSFSRDAQREASRDGAPPIDLLDGERFIQKLKELRLGVEIKLVEEISIDESFFKSI